MIKKVLSGALALVAIAGTSEARAGVPADNDPFATPLELTGPEAAVPGDTTDGSAEPGEPAHAGEPAERSLWYRYTAPANGTVAIDTCTTMVNPRIAVYTGATLTSLALVAGNSGGCEDMRLVAADGSRVRFPATAGTTYRIAVDSQAPGDFTTHLVFTADPVTEPADTVAPDTTITAAPQKKVKRKRATFAFSSNEVGVSFECSLNGAAFAPCVTPAMVKGKKGRNTFAVRARDAAGNLDASLATYSWKVKKKRRT